MNKVAVITGGSRGIGFGIAVALAKKNFDILITGRKDISELNEVIKELENFGTKIKYLAADISDFNTHDDIVKKALDEFGRIDVFVNNAGVAPKTRLDILETTPESYDYVVDTNLKSVFFLSQKVANTFIDLKSKLEESYSPQLIFITSISATVASVSRGEYCVSKAGLAMTAQLFATRLAEHNINVYEIRPGVIKTDMTGTVAEKYDKLFSEGLSLQPRWGSPEDIGKAVSALAEGAFPYSTGSVFVIDGGITVARL